MLVASSLDAGLCVEMPQKFFNTLHSILLGCIPSHSGPQGAAELIPPFYVWIDWRNQLRTVFSGEPYEDYRWNYA
jgi:hypothetical protein